MEENMDFLTWILIGGLTVFSFVAGVGLLYKYLESKDRNKKLRLKES